LESNEQKEKMNRFFGALKSSKAFNPLFKAAGIAMESRLRHWLHDPVKIMKGSDIRSGDTVLEVGCGTGFFTVAAARLIGEQGHLMAMDALPAYVERVSQKVQSANLKNVRVIEGDALETGLDSGSLDVVMLFGVIPFPSLPLSRLLPEMHRILKPKGILAVWLFPTEAGVPQSILKSGLFTYISKRNGVHNYRKYKDYE
jgi:demethylmenaquinone methyltransferase/2-methoxy-6-polyprenyl-1,4-benzoquinol methylase